MQNENVYIGDDKFQRFLDHYQCPTPLSLVKMKFAGAICSPNANLRPTDVITSLFLEENQPRLVTKGEAELFFKFFMGLWDEMFVIIRTNTLELPRYIGKHNDAVALTELCRARAIQIEMGFAEGFWGGCSTLNIPQFVAELLSSLTDLAGVYGSLATKLEQQEDPKIIFSVIQNTDKTVEKTLHFLIEHFVLPNISKLERMVN